MVELPIILKLKKQIQKGVALAQDILMKELRVAFSEVVLHGGTAIWRCYAGNRFSEDIDVYIPNDKEKLQILFENLKKKGFVIERKKTNENSLYSTLMFNRARIRFEALFKKVKGTLRDYETCEGNFITIATLTPEEIIREKIPTYEKRLKIRDLYDIFFLLRHIKNKEDIRDEVKEFIKNFKRPIDEKDLRNILLDSLIPSVEDMLIYIKREIS